MKFLLEIQYPLILEVYIFPYFLVHLYVHWKLTAKSILDVLGVPQMSNVKDHIPGSGRKEPLYIPDQFDHQQ